MLRHNPIGENADLVLEARWQIRRNERFEGRRNVIFHHFLWHVRTCDALDRQMARVLAPERIAAKRRHNERMVIEFAFVPR